MVVMESDSQHDIGGTFSSLHMPNAVRIWQGLAHYIFRTFVFIKIGNCALVASASIRAALPDLFR